MTDQDELSQGHLFTISVTGKGVHRIVGDPMYYEDGWEGPPMTVKVRAFSLKAALEKAIELPFAVWFQGWVEFKDLHPEATSAVRLEPEDSTDRLMDFAEWLIRLDTPEGAADRQIVTLTEIINRAQAAME